MLKVNPLNSYDLPVTGEEIGANGIKTVLNNELNGIEIYFPSKPGQNVLYNVEEKNGFIITSSKYSSCDNRQYDEILNHFEEQGIKPIINTCKPSF